MRQNLLELSIVQQFPLYLPVACKTLPHGRGKGRRVGNFKYSEDLDCSDLVTAVRLDSHKAGVKVIRESRRG